MREQCRLLPRVRQHERFWNGSGSGADGGKTGEEGELARLVIADDLDALVAVFPCQIAAALLAVNRSEDLLEIVLDLGRKPNARFVDGEVELSDSEVTQEEIDHVVGRISTFGADNRAGIERTLHRISCIRNRQGKVAGDPGGVREHGMVGNGSVEEPGRPATVFARAEYAD